VKKACVLLLFAACGAKQTGQTESIDQFQCKDRKAAYFVVGSMTGREAGAEISCKEHGPQITRYVVERDGTKVEDSRAMSPGEFDDVWTRIDGAGWRHLGDCAGEKGKDIPVYTFDLADWEDSKSFECDSTAPPFPYDGIVQELDQLAATIPGDRGANVGDDE
jgi:hypothetical protein